jgi:hypothetical protein
LQNYYDGIRFNVRSLENIKKKIAVYNEQFFGVRPFVWIVRRIKKYHKRGYNIHFGLNFLTRAKQIKMTDENRQYHHVKQFNLNKTEKDIESGFDFLMNSLGCEN